MVIFFPVRYVSHYQRVIWCKKNAQALVGHYQSNGWGFTKSSSACSARTMIAIPGTTKIPNAEANFAAWIAWIVGDFPRILMGWDGSIFFVKWDFLVETCDACDILLFFDWNLSSYIKYIMDLMAYSIKFVEVLYNHSSMSLGWKTWCHIVTSLDFQLVNL